MGNNWVQLEMYMYMDMEFLGFYEQNITKYGKYPSYKYFQVLLIFRI